MIDSFCSTVWNPSSAQTRVVTVYSCPDTGKSVSAMTTACIAHPYLQVKVAFDDYPAQGSAPIGICTLWGWCGQGQTISLWKWQANSA
jgi:hypothetical protein